MKRYLILALALILTLPAFAQVGRYKDIKVLYPGYTLKFDTATGEYTTVKWKPLDKNGKEVEADIDTAVTNAVESMKKILKGLEDKLDRTQKDTSVVV